MSFDDFVRRLPRVSNHLLCKWYIAIMFFGACGASSGALAGRYEQEAAGYAVTAVIILIMIYVSSLRELDAKQCAR